MFSIAQNNEVGTPFEPRSGETLEEQPHYFAGNYSKCLMRLPYNFDSGTISGAVFSPSVAENSLSSFRPDEDIRIGIFMITLR